MKRVLDELRRRNVLRAAILYVGAIWALAQGIAQLGPTFGMPDWGTRWFVVAGIVGFPLWIAFAWFFELTPEGLKRERDVAPGESIAPRTGRKLDVAIIGVLAIAVVLLVTDRFVLRHGVNATEPAPEKSIAVLPFVNLSSDKEQEYFSDGIAEDLLNLLAAVKPLRVAARTSSFSFKDKDVAIPEIAKALHVANVLEGSVRRAGDEVRITAQLVRAADGYQIWSRSWDRKLDDIFKIQDEIAAAVVGELRVALLGEAPPTAKPLDPRAYPLILKARALAEKQTKASRAEALAIYNDVLAIEPNDARAWAGIARTYFNQTLTGDRSAEEGGRLATEAANHALRIDPENTDALSLMGRLVCDYALDLPAGARYLQRVLDREPGNSLALNGAAGLLMKIGRFDEAIALFRYRAARDPTNATAFNNLGVAYGNAKRWDEAIDVYRETLRLSPDFTDVQGAIAMSLLGKGDAEGALEALEAERDDDWRAYVTALVQHRLGHREEADAALRRVIETSAEESPVSVAAIYSFRGEVDAAFEWLDKAIAAHDPGVSTALSDTSFDGVRDDPRWLPFLRKIGYAPEQLAKIEFTVMLPEEAVQVTAAESAAR